MFFWITYYLLILLISYLFCKLVKNKFICYFFVPIIIGFFGSIWFISPGSGEMAPIISIFFLESSILESNGINRLFRPLIVNIFILEFLSFIYYFLKKIYFKS